MIINANQIDVKTNVNDPNFNIWLESNLTIIRELLSEGPWNKVGEVGQPAFQNSWANEGLAHSEDMAFRKHGIHHLEIIGHIVPGTTADGTVLFYLPELYWPYKRINVAGTSHNPTSKTVFYGIEISEVDGAVTVHGLPSNTDDVSMHFIVNLDNNGA